MSSGRMLQVFNYIVIIIIINKYIILILMNINYNSFLMQLLLLISSL